MKNILYWIECYFCSKRTKANLLKSVTDYEKEKTQHTYRCLECKRIVTNEIDLKGK